MEPNLTDIDDFEALIDLHSLGEESIGQKISEGVLQLLFSNGRHDIIGWLQPEVLNLPSDMRQIVDLILSAPLDKVGSIGGKLIRILHDNLREFFIHLAKADNLKSVIVIRRILKSELFWLRPEDTLDFLRSLQFCSEIMSQAIFVGHHDPNKITFIEEVVTRFGGPSIKMLFKLLEFLVGVDGVEGVYAIKAFERYEDYIRTSLSEDVRLRTYAQAFFEDIIQSAEGEFLNWFLERISPYLNSKSRWILYSEALVEQCVLVEMRASSAEEHNQLATIPLSTISSSADICKVREYVNWLICNGRLRQLSPAAVSSLIRRLRSDTDSSTIKDIIFCYSIAETKKRDEFLKLTLIDPDITTDILDSFGESGWFASYRDREELLKSTVNASQTLVSHIWMTSVNKSPSTESYNKLRVIRELIDLANPDPLISSSQQRMKLLVSFDIESKYRILILSHILQFNYEEPGSYFSITSERWNTFISFLISDVPRMDPHTILEAAIMISKCAHKDMVKQFVETTGSPQVARGFNFTLTRILDSLKNLGGGHHGSYYARNYERCGLLIYLLQDKLTVDLQLIRDVILNENGSEYFICQSLLPLLKSQKQTAEVLSLGQLCLLRIMYAKIPDKAALVLEYQEYIEDKICELFLGYDWNDALMFIAKDQLRAYCSKYPEKYLEKLLNLWLVDFKHALKFFRSIQLFPDKIEITEKILSLGSRKFETRTEKLAGINMQVHRMYEILKDRETKCQSCDQGLSGNVFLDVQQGFGKYICSKCAPFSEITKAVLGSCVVCQEHEDMHILKCKHLCCGDCLAGMNIAGDSRCPVCRKDIFKIEEVQVDPSTVVQGFLKEVLPAS